MWIQPSSLTELLELKARYPDAKLVVGNTEVGESVSLAKEPGIGIIANYVSADKDFVLALWCKQTE